MRIANLNDRAAIVVGGADTDTATAADVATVSGGRFGPSPATCFEQWDELRGWAAGATAAIEAAAQPFERKLLGPPSPMPRQVFGIGLNYAAHAAEADIALPKYPTTFTKFPTCITGPFAEVELPSASVDWEVELVVVIGRYAHKVNEADGWGHVAGLTVGQDISERRVQMRPPVPQFNLGKSFPGFGPTGPWVVTADELTDPDDLALSCEIGGETMQSSRTDDLVFSVARLIQELSSITPLLPGDLIFTGTPSGVGMARKPPRFLTASDVLTSTIEGIGTITTTFRQA